MFRACCIMQRFRGSQQRKNQLSIKTFVCQQIQQLHIISPRSSNNINDFSFQSSQFSSKNDTSEAKIDQKIVLSEKNAGLSFNRTTKKAFMKKFGHQQKIPVTELKTMNMEDLAKVFIQLVLKNATHWKSCEGMELENVSQFMFFKGNNELNTSWAELNAQYNQNPQLFINTVKSLVLEDKRIKPHLITSGVENSENSDKEYLITPQQMLLIQNSLSVEKRALKNQKLPTPVVSNKEQKHKANTQKFTSPAIKTSIKNSAPNTSIKVLTVSELATMQNEIQDIKLLLPPENYTAFRESVKNRIRNDLLKECKNMRKMKGAQLHLFGSSANGFGTVTADLDMNLSFNWEASKEQRISMCKRLNKVICKMGMKNVQARFHARVPVILFTDPKTGLSCDIAFAENNLAVHNTHLLRVYSEIDVRVKELGYLVKYWAKQRDINNAANGTLSSYAWILKVIYFLQNLPTPILPNLQAIPHNWDGLRPPDMDLDSPLTTKIDETGECNVHFFKPGKGTQWRALKAPAKLNTSTTAELLKQFYSFYLTEFNYERDVISIRQGGERNQLGAFTSFVTRQDKPEWSHENTFCIEDPFEINHNVARALKSDSHVKIIEEMQVDRIGSKGVQPRPEI